MMSSTAAYEGHDEQRGGRASDKTHSASIYQWLNDVREQCRDVRLSDLVLVPRDFEPHSDLHVSQLSTKLILFRILS